MKILRLVCELWLVELFIKGGEVSYWCERCHQDAVLAKPVKSKSLFINNASTACRSKFASQADNSCQKIIRMDDTNFRAAEISTPEQAKGWIEKLCQSLHQLSRLFPFAHSLESEKTTEMTLSSN